MVAYWLSLVRNECYHLMMMSRLIFNWLNVLSSVCDCGVLKAELKDQFGIDVPKWKKNNGK